MVPRKNAVLLEEEFIAGTVAGCLFHNDSITNTSAGKLEEFANVFEHVDRTADLGARTLKELCAEYEVGVKDVVALLKQHGVEATPDLTFGAVAEAAGVSVAELFALVSSNL